MQHDLSRVLTQAYRPFERPTDLAQALVDALAEHAGVPAVELRLHSDDSCIRASRAGSVAHSLHSRSCALVYQQRALGELATPPHAASTETEQRFLCAFARAVSLVLQRYDVRAQARAALGSDLWFVGVAPSLRRFEEQLELVAPLEMPLVIQSEFGCETRAAAFAVHAASRPGEPFRELRCGEPMDAAAFKATLDRLRAELTGGTLFLPDIDALDPGCQRHLAGFLGACATPQLPLSFEARTAPPLHVRVVASARKHLRHLLEQGVLSNELWAALDYLRLQMPPLRERREDIPFFIDHFGAVYGRAGRVRFTPDAAAVLAAWHWPGNLIELERTLARLMATARTAIIDTDHLREWAAELLPDAAVSPRGRVALDRAPLDEESGTPRAELAPAPLTLARQLMAGRFDDIDAFHPGLQRALRYLAHHFHEEIALERLARESFVSPSYLCALFKKSVGMGFKRFQSLLRVEKAKDLLMHKRHDRITDISLEVGFGDFSHFLKTFKRSTHISPREFRKQHVQAAGRG